MPVEAERSLIGSAGCQGENPIALFARPLLTGLCQRFANTASLRCLIRHQFPDVSLTLTSKVRVVRDSCEAQSFSVLFFSHEDPRLCTILFDASCNPALSCH